MEPVHLRLILARSGRFDQTAEVELAIEVPPRGRDHFAHFWKRERGHTGHPEDSGSGVTTGEALRATWGINGKVLGCSRRQQIILGVLNFQVLGNGRAP
jgi:hypothetical protein